MNKYIRILIVFFIFFSVKFSLFAQSNRAPQIISLKAYSDPAIGGEPVQLTCDAIDLDEDFLFFEWEVENGFIDGEGNAVDWIPENQAGGLAKVICIVRDGKGGVAKDTLMETVRTGPNHNPTIVGIFPDKKAIQVNETDKIICAAYDVDGDKLTFHLRSTLPGTFVSIQNNTIIYKPSVTGNHEIIFQIFDGKGGNVSKSITLTVN